jgi:hypothetical protein
MHVQRCYVQSTFQMAFSGPLTCNNVYFYQTPRTNMSFQPSKSSIALPPLGLAVPLAGAGLPAAGAFAPYKPAWLFCFAISAIVIPFAGAAFFFKPEPASRPAKASPPAAFFAGCAPILGDATLDPGVAIEGEAAFAIGTDVK